MARRFQVRLLKNGVNQTTIITAQSPGEARRIAEAQYPGYRVVGTVDKGQA
ncbi:MAG: hypothetical protein HWE39_10020 [Oceanospirillaceae bacterium]|nr:hypothetical protein [Oceanospirillaceae bacterium]